MTFFLLILLCHFLNNVVYSDQIEIKILKIENGYETPVKSVINNEKEANFSLRCGLVGTTSDTIIWGKIKTKLKLFDENTMMKNNITTNPILKFNCATITDQGIYFCASPLHKLFKTVLLLIKPKIERKDEIFRHKRLVDDYNMNNLNIMHDNWLEYLEKMREEGRRLEAQEQKRKEKERELEIELSIKQEREKSESNSLKIGFGLFGFFIIVGILSCVIYKRNKVEHRVVDDVVNVDHEARRIIELRNRITQLNEAIDEEIDNMQTQSQSNDLGTHQETRPLKGDTCDAPPSYEEAMDSHRPSAPPQV